MTCVKLELKPLRFVPFSSFCLARPQNRRSHHQGETSFDASFLSSVSYPHPHRRCGRACGLFDLYLFYLGPYRALCLYPYPYPYPSLSLSMSLCPISLPMSHLSPYVPSLSLSTVSLPISRLLPC